MSLCTWCSDFSLLITQLEVTKDECLSLQAQRRTALDKEVHWTRELSGTAAQLRLAEERVVSLEKKGRGRERRVIELETRLETAQQLGAVRQEEV